MEVANFRLKFLLLLHFIFSTFVLQGGWPPSSYLFYNLLLCLVMLWAVIDRTSDEPFLILFVMELVCMVFDLFTLIYYCPAFIYAYLSITVAIAHLAFRGYAAAAVASVHADRLGRPDSDKWVLLGFGSAEQSIRRHINLGPPMSAQSGPSAARADYMNVDAPNPPGSVPPPYAAEPTYNPPYPQQQQ